MQVIKLVTAVTYDCPIIVANKGPDTPVTQNCHSVALEPRSTEQSSLSHHSSIKHNFKLILSLVVVSTRQHWAFKLNFVEHILCNWQEKLDVQQFWTELKHCDSNYDRDHAMTTYTARLLQKHTCIYTWLCDLWHKVCLCIVISVNTSAGSLIYLCVCVWLCVCSALCVVTQVSHAAPGGNPPVSCLVMLARCWQWCTFSEGPQLQKMKPPQIEHIEHIEARQHVSRLWCFL